MKRNKKVLFIWLAVVVLLVSCHSGKIKHEKSQFMYPESKIWAHKVNDTSEAKVKEHLFVGLEVDLYYSEFQKTIYVGHDAWDTAKKVTFEKWLSVLTNPSSLFFWLDFKNLNINNAEDIANKLLVLSNTYLIRKKVMIENTNPDALKIVKNKGFAVILWVDDLYWWEHKDTAYWYQKTEKNIEKLNPDAISSEYRMASLLTDFFPDLNVHIWNTPIKESIPNIALTRKLCKDTSIKVVLVDYASPNLP